MRVTDTPTPITVLVTGSAGEIGRAVCRELLSRGHRVRAADRVLTPDMPDALTLDLSDPAATARACEGVDVIIHLAAQADPRSPFLEDILPNNIVATYNVFESARLMGVKRVVFASSMHVGHKKQPGQVATADLPTAPKNLYGASKVFGEAVGHVYALTHNISVLAVRIGFLPRSVAHVRGLIEGNAFGMYVSPGDCGRFFSLCVEAVFPESPPESPPKNPPETRLESSPRNPRFHVLYAYGPDGDRAVDMRTTRELIGYEPRDRWPVGVEHYMPDNDATKSDR